MARGSTRRRRTQSLRSRYIACVVATVLGLGGGYPVGVMWSVMAAPLVEFAGVISCPVRPVVCAGLLSPLIAVAVAAIRGRRRWHIEEWILIVGFSPSFFLGALYGASLLDVVVFP